MTEPLAGILAVDDDPHQLDTLCRGLALYGYRCRGALNVETALELLASDEGVGIDLVLTDLTMPGRSGLELIERLREERPTLPIVVVTGLAASAELAAVRKLGLPLLEKPFAPDALDAVIGQTLGIR